MTSSADEPLPLFAWRKQTLSIKFFVRQPPVAGQDAQLFLNTPSPISLFLMARHISDYYTRIPATGMLADPGNCRVREITLIKKLFGVQHEALLIWLTNGPFLLVQRHTTLGCQKFALDQAQWLTEQPHFLVQHGWTLRYPTPGMTLLRLSFILEAISIQEQHYTLYGKNCYWFAAAVRATVIRVNLNLQTPGTDEPHLQLIPGRAWDGFYYIIPLKSQIRDPEINAIVQRYNEAYNTHQTLIQIVQNSQTPTPGPVTLH